MLADSQSRRHAMRVTWALLRLDLRGVVRDSVLSMNAAASIVVTLAIAGIGLFESHDPVWRARLPPLLALVLVSGPLAWGFLFGLLMVDERDSGVRGALAVTPLTPRRMLLVRATTVTALMIVWPAIALRITIACWSAHETPLGPSFALVCALALSAPLTALAVASFANDKVEAMALYKGLNFFVLAPLALYVVPADAWYRPLFLVLPTTWAIRAFDAIRLGEPAYPWLLGSAAIHLVLLAVCVRKYAALLYKDSA